MKQLSVIFALASLMVIIGCQKAVDVGAEKAAVAAVLTTYIQSIENEEIDLYGKILAHDPTMVNFGTEARERIVGWDALRELILAQNAALSDTKIVQSDVTVDLSPDGHFAWATCMWDFKTTVGSQAVQLPVRCSWVLEKRGDGWTIVHFHKSVGTT